MVKQRKQGFLNIMIDGQTGKNLFKTDIIHKRGGSRRDPVYEFLESLKEKNKPKTTAFHGKTYTEEALLGAVVIKILN